MHNLIRASLVFLLAASAYSCASPTDPARTSQGDEPAPPPGPGTQVTLADGTALAGGAAVLRGSVMDDGSLSYALLVMGTDGQQTWQVEFDSLATAGPSLPVGGPALSGKAAVVSLARSQPTSALTLAESGTLTLSVGVGQATGEVHATPSSLDASFVAELSVECWVPVPADSENQGVPGARRLDASFAHPGCAPLRGLR